MKQIAINNYQDLFDFIKADYVTAEQASEIVCKTLGVYSVFHKTKAELIAVTTYYIETFCNGYEGEKPIFLEQKGTQFSVQDMFNVPELKEIINDLEARY